MNLPAPPAPEAAPRATMTAAEARELRAAHDADARALSRKGKAALLAIDKAEMRARGRERLYGTFSKDELISDILGLRGYPAEKLNEAIHVLHHGPGESWPVCEWCHPHGDDRCECILGRQAAAVTA